MSKIKDFISKKKNTETLIKKHRLIGVGYGKKTKDGEKTSNEAIVCLVQRKMPLSALSADEVLPKSINIDGEEILIDVVEIGHVKALLDHKSKHRPIVAGISLGHKDITAGTLGCLVKKNGDDFVYILSNNHVIANSNDAKIGDEIYQPGPMDGGYEPVANLTDYVKIKFSNSIDTPHNRVDAALARIVGQNPVNNDPPVVDQPKKRNFFQKILDFFRNIFNSLFSEEKIFGSAFFSLSVDYSNYIFNFPKTIEITGNLENVNVGDVVLKSGRTTGLTYGEVIATNAVIDVDYGGPWARFENQIVTSNMSFGGDSGSLVFNDKGNAVGLLFAGSDQATILNPIDDVFHSLGIEKILSTNRP